MGNAATARAPMRTTAARSRRAVENIDIARIFEEIADLLDRPATVEALVSAGAVRSVADLFVLTDADLRKLGRFGPTSALNLAAAIDAARRVDLTRLLTGLGIPEVGPSTARRLAERFHTLGAVRSASAEQLAGTPGVGGVAAERIAAFLRVPHTCAVLDALQRHGLTVLPLRGRRAGLLAGQTVVFTGALG
jgi:DNA ligase (NAD+)